MYAVDYGLSSFHDRWAAEILLQRVVEDMVAQSLKQFKRKLQSC